MTTQFNLAMRFDDSLTSRFTYLFMLMVLVFAAKLTT